MAGHGALEAHVHEDRVTGLGNSRPSLCLSGLPLLCTLRPLPSSASARTSRHSSAASGTSSTSGFFCVSACTGLTQEAYSQLTLPSPTLIWKVKLVSYDARLRTPRRLSPILENLLTANVQ